MSGGSPLGAALRLFRAHGPELLAPPGSEAAIGLLLALGGWEVGLTMPTRLALVRSVRIWFTEGPVASAGALAAGGPPTILAVGIWMALALAVTLLAAGWIRTALAIAQGQPTGDSPWTQWERGALWILGWSAATLVWIAAVGLLINQVGWLALHGGLSRPGRPLLLLGLGSLVLRVFAVGVGVYCLAATSLGAVVAIAEPERSFRSIFSRAPRVFLAGGGWQAGSDIVILLGAWWIVRALLAQLLLPVAAIHHGLPALAFGIAATALAAILTLGDAIVLVIVIVLGAVVYQRGSALLPAGSAGPPRAHWPGRNRSAPRSS